VVDRDPAGRGAAGGGWCLCSPGQGGQWEPRDGPGGWPASSPVFEAPAGRVGSRALGLVCGLVAGNGTLLAGAPGAPGLDRADVVQPVLWGG